MPSLTPVRSVSGDAEEALQVGLVLGEQQLGRRPGRFAVEPSPPVARRIQLDDRGAANRVDRAHARLRGRAVPGPGVAEPRRRQQVERRRLGTAVEGGHLHHQIFGVDLRVLDEDVEVAGLVEDAGVDELVLGRAAVATAILVDQVGVGKRRLRILVEHPHEAVGRRRVEIEVVLLDVLAVVALVAGQAEEALLQNRVAAVPQRQRETQLLVAIADAGNAVLVPAIGARARVLVRQVFPRRAGGAVVLTDRAPRPVADVRAPSLPVHLSQARLFEPPFFRRHDCCLVHLRTRDAGTPEPETYRLPRDSSRRTPPRPPCHPSAWRSEAPIHRRGADGGCHRIRPCTVDTQERARDTRSGTRVEFAHGSRPTGRPASL
jgi:hypothetical protein